MADVNDEIVDDAPEESTTRRVVKKRKVSVAAKTIIV